MDFWITEERKEYSSLTHKGVNFLAIYCSVEKN